MQFVGRRWLWYAIGGGLVLLSILLVAFKGLNFGIDFKGGRIKQFLARGISADDKTIIAEVRKALGNLGKTAVVQVSRGKDVRVLLRIPPVPNEESEEVNSKMIGALKKLGAKEPEILLDDYVGPIIGKELIRSALWAVIWAIVAILVYVAFRFDVRFGIASILALVHDVMVTIGFFSLTGLEVNTPFVAALLTIVGYSINNSIVVSDKVRENIRLYWRKKTLPEIVDISINQTLMRCINTSLTTLLVVVAMLIFGGTTLRPFLWALFVGIVAGTFSSVCLVGSFVVTMEKLGGRA